MRALHPFLAASIMLLAPLSSASTASVGGHAVHFEGDSRIIDCGVDIVQPSARRNLADGSVSASAGYRTLCLNSRDNIESPHAPHIRFEVQGVTRYCLGNIDAWPFPAGFPLDCHVMASSTYRTYEPPYPLDPVHICGLSDVPVPHPGWELFEVWCFGHDLHAAIEGTEPFGYFVWQSQWGTCPPTPKCWKTGFPHWDLTVRIEMARKTGYRLEGGPMCTTDLVAEAADVRKDYYHLLCHVQAVQYAMEPYAPLYPVEDQVAEVAPEQARCVRDPEVRNCKPSAEVFLAPPRIAGL